MSERIVRRRLVGRTVRWGFDALGMFFPFPKEADARKAAETWTDEYLRREGSLAITSCPAVEEDAAG